MLMLIDCRAAACHRYAFDTPITYDRLSRCHRTSRLTNIDTPRLRDITPMPNYGRRCPFDVARCQMPPSISRAILTSFFDTDMPPEAPYDVTRRMMFHGKPLPSYHLSTHIIAIIDDIDTTLRLVNADDTMI